ELLFRKDPAAAQSAQAVGLGQAAGDKKASGIETQCSWRTLVEQHLEIDLVHQNARADLRRQVADLPEHIVRHQHTARVMHVGEDDELRRGRQVALEVRKIRLELRGEWPLETSDLQSQVARGA